MPTLRDLRRVAVPVGAQVAGGVINNRAANSAVNRGRAGTAAAKTAINAGADAGRNALDQGYKDQQGYLDPYRNAGSTALPTLEQGTQPGGDFNTPFNNDTFKLYEDPSFQWRLDQGRKAIEAQRNASGTRFSGAFYKQIDNDAQNRASQEYQAAFARQQADVQGRYNRVSGVANMGLDAAGAESNAAGNHAANTANLDATQAQQLSNLQIDLANAEAEGDVAKANSITDTINGVLQTVDRAGVVNRIASIGAPVASAVAGTAGASAAGAALGTSSMVTGASGVALPGLTAPVTVGGTGVAAGGGGASAAITGFLTNPITIAAGAALGIGLLIRHAQAHHKADEFIQTFTNKFDKTMDQINQLERSGQMSPEDAVALRNAAVADYVEAGKTFAAKGKDQAKVVRQGMDTFRKAYGDPSQYGVTA